MRIGVPREVKDGEFRVGMTPAGAHLLLEDGHEVTIERKAGLGSNLTDEEYTRAGATVLPDAKEVYDRSELIVKVKEPQPGELKLLRKDHILFTYLHLAAEPELTRSLLEIGLCAIGYETVELDDGQLPLLIPMSEVAGKMAVQEGAKYLESAAGGRGILLGGVPGVKPAQVVVLGGGTAGLNAAKTANGMGANVTVFDISLPRLRYISDILPGITTLTFTPHALRNVLPTTDLVIGTVLVRGARAPRLLTKDMLALLPKGAVIVDVSIDQGGCIETSRPTTHSHPTYQVEGIVHYCVTNMPGAVANTSTFALTASTLPYVRVLAGQGIPVGLQSHPELARGVNVWCGKLTTSAVAEALRLPFTPIYEML